MNLEKYVYTSRDYTYYSLPIIGLGLPIIGYLELRHGEYSISAVQRGKKLFNNLFKTSDAPAKHCSAEHNIVVLIQLVVITLTCSSSSSIFVYYNIIDMPLLLHKDVKIK